MVSDLALGILDHEHSDVQPSRYLSAGCGLIFSAASLNLMAFNRFTAPDPTVGQIFVLFIMGLAAAEVAIALSIIIAVYRNYRSVKTRELSDLSG